MFSFTYPKVRIKTDLKASQTRKHSDKNKTTEKNYVPEIKVTPERLAIFETTFPRLSKHFIIFLEDLFPQYFKFEVSFLTRTLS